MMNEERKVHLVGAGIANMAVAAYLLKDGGFNGANISIYEQGALTGGCFEAIGDPEKGYSMQGERMFEKITSACTTCGPSWPPAPEHPSPPRPGTPSCSSCPGSRHDRGAPAAEDPPP